MIKMCSFCKHRPPMIRCRDCEQPAACFICTINKPTGGFCQDHYLRFIKLHWNNHGEEFIDTEPEEARKMLVSLDEKDERSGGPHSDGSRLAF